MRYVPVNKISSGMIAAQEVRSTGRRRSVPLITPGVVLTPQLRSRLVDAGINSLLINDMCSAGIDVDPAIGEALYADASIEMRVLLTTVGKSSAVLSSDRIRAAAGMICDVASAIHTHSDQLLAFDNPGLYVGDDATRSVAAAMISATIASRHLMVHGWVDYRGTHRTDRVAERVESLAVAAALMDVSLIANGIEVGSSSSMPVSERQAIVQSHPLLSTEMLRGANLSPMVAVAVAQHHERIDGSGYPKGLEGIQCDVNGQIVALASAYVASRFGSDHGRRLARLSPLEAYRRIVVDRIMEFAPDVIESFASSVAPYGPGCAVRLSDGRYGLVERVDPLLPLRPRVRITQDDRGRSYPLPEPLNLRDDLSVTILESLQFLPGDG